MKNPKVGDRVMVYATLNGTVAESKGTILGVEGWGRGGRQRLIVQLENQREIYAHPKQCRRLIPRVAAKPEQIWNVSLGPKDKSSLADWNNLMRFLAVLGDCAKQVQATAEETL